MCENAMHLSHTGNRLLKGKVTTPKYTHKNMTIFFSDPNSRLPNQNSKEIPLR